MCTILKDKLKYKQNNSNKKIFKNSIFFFRKFSLAKEGLIYASKSSVNGIIKSFTTPIIA